MAKTESNQSKESPSVGVVGCGWLGQALVESLIARSYRVVATTQQTEKLALIEKLGAQAEILSLPLNNGEGDNAAVFYCQTLVVCITPQFRQGKTDYPQKISQIVKKAERGHVEKIIMISSTAIYDGIFGSATEESQLKRNIGKVDLLAEAEQAILAFSGKVVILRCAGLVGKDRHPGKFIRHSRMLTAPNAYVNLIHQDDVVAQILAFIESNIHSGIFNAVSEMQVTKKHYYSIAASALNLPEPEFDHHSKLELGKQVIGDKLRDQLDYQFIHGDLVTWLLKA